MRLRQTFLAVSLAKRTVLFVPARSSVVAPLEKSQKGSVDIELGSQHHFDSEEVWIVTQECGVS